MKLELTIVRADGEPLPPGSLARVEIRDSSLADAPAVVVTRKDVRLPKARRGSARGERVEIDVPTVPDGATVRVHVDVDGDGRVSSGDFVSVQSYPITPASAPQQTIEVKRVS